MKQKVIFFESPAALRKWLEAHHDSRTEVWAGFYKKDSGKPSITWPEAVEECLCFGWIDGIRKSIDGISYKIRLTPRKPRSTWSAVNIRLVAKLISEGRMRPPGLEAFEKRTEDRSLVYSYEREKHKLSKEYETKFKANKKAWQFFQSQPPGYRRLCSFYVISAKKEETRLRRLEALIRDSAEGRRIAQLMRKE